MKETAGGRVIFLDGVRGLVAALIVLSHAYWEVFPSGKGTVLPALAQFVYKPLEYPNKVSVFVALSGFLLAWTCLKQNPNKPVIKGGLKEFFLRRALRIIPPYYACLVLFLFLIATVPALHAPAGVRWDVALVVGESHGVLLSHALLLHNLSLDWMLKINPPLWSLAVEWQLYYFFAFLFVPIWRRFGLAPVVGLSFALGLLPHFLLPATQNYDWTCPWFLAIFGLSFIAAKICRQVPPKLLLKRARYAPLWGIFLLLGVVQLTNSWSEEAARIPLDITFGVLTLCILVKGTVSVAMGERSFLRLFLESRPLQFLGKISFSLYLIHFPLLSLMHHYLRQLWGSADSSTLSRVLFLHTWGFTICLVATIVFYKTIENPLVSLSTRIREQWGKRRTAIPVF